MKCFRGGFKYSLKLVGSLSGSYAEGSPELSPLSLRYFLNLLDFTWVVHPDSTPLQVSEDVTIRRRLYLYISLQQVLTRDLLSRESTCTLLGLRPVEFTRLNLTSIQRIV